RGVLLILVCAGIDDAIHAALAAPPAHGEVKGAIGTNCQIGDIHRRTLAELLNRGLVASSLALQMYGPNDAERPVTHEVCPAILLRERNMIVELQADWRPATCLLNWRETIDVIAGRVGRSGPPDEVCARRAVADPHRAVPRQPLIPFHVAVEGEEF